MARNVVANGGGVFCGKIIVGGDGARGQRIHPLVPVASPHRSSNDLGAVSDDEFFTSRVPHPAVVTISSWPDAGEGPRWCGAGARDLRRH